MAFLRRTCKEVAALLIAREDRILSFDNRLTLRMHLLACKACPNFERQLLTLRQAMKHRRNYVEEDAQTDP